MTESKTAGAGIRYALLYPDGSLNVLKPGTRDDALRDAAVYAEHEETIPDLVRVRIEIVTDDDVQDEAAP